MMFRYFQSRPKLPGLGGIQQKSALDAFEHRGYLMAEAAHG
jgi:hypothetical protein